MLTSLEVGGGTSAAPHGGPLLELRGVSKRFGSVEALVDVNFEIYRGEIVALVGDNGAGKSTLAKVNQGCSSPIPERFASRAAK